jgi:UTP:GlnB (protein PII) uridylyltransferase
VTVEFGDRLGELLDTMTALKNLGLDIRKAKVDVAAAAQAAAGGNGGSASASGARSKPSTFYITEASTSEKVLKSSRLEEIRMTIIQNMLQYHPESGAALAAGPAHPPAASPRDPTSPLGAGKTANVQTTIAVRDAPNGSCSLLHITTRDRPGLLVDIVSVLKDINVNVVSAEVDTIGDTADDELFVTYHGEPLAGPMTQLVTNALQYYLSLAEVAKEESY